MPGIGNNKVTKSDLYKATEQQTETPRKEGKLSSGRKVRKSRSKHSSQAKPPAESPIHKESHPIHDRKPAPLPGKNQPYLPVDSYDSGIESDFDSDDLDSTTRTRLNALQSCINNKPEAPLYIWNQAIETTLGEVQREAGEPVSQQDYRKALAQHTVETLLSGKASLHVGDVQEKINFFNNRKLPETLNPGIKSGKTGDKNADQPAPLANAHKQQEKSHHLEDALLAGSTAAAVVSGAAVAVASAAQPAFDKSQFAHILQKDIPLDQMVIFGQHNAGALAGQGTLPLIAANQTMTIEDTLERTPVRGFDLDLHQRHGEVVINHGGVFDPSVSDNKIPRLEDTLQTMNNWLDRPENQDEVLFLKFENEEHLPHSLLEDVFGDNTVMGSQEYNRLAAELGETPSINDIRAAGYEVVLLDSGYRSSGTGVTGVGDLRMDSIWEDRLIWEHVRDYDLEFGEYTTADIARPITVEKVDDIIESGTPTYVSLDKISPNDPRFFQPEDRDSLGLRPDLKLMGLFYET